ncbi:MAG: methylated-DNA--[protein]-cysteine S-methyltransferase [Verrucomicrobia bacterium]|nr:methylated-DNA--[protein]-cysteine S-methyltransferase [Verrucomicrobiota bacterium]
MNTMHRPIPDAEQREAWRRRDARYDGAFVIAVSTTGIYCRPSCPSRPAEDHVAFLPDAAAAEQAGYRACRRCTPDRMAGEPPEAISRLLRQVEASPDTRISAADLRALGLAPDTVRRWFLRHRGMTFSTWCRRRRLGAALQQLGAGAPLDDVALGHGFESHSGFRSAFERLFGKAPGQLRTGQCLHVALLPTPLGSMLVAADRQVVRRLVFADPAALADSYRELSRTADMPVVPGSNPVLERLAGELEEYFAGRRRAFSVPLDGHGTPFQERVWAALRNIPWGETQSYGDIARRLGTPRAIRAVARANAANPLYLLNPCHRVIGKDGKLTGYAGGLWRKDRLLALEQAGHGNPSLFPEAVLAASRTSR